MLYNNLSLCHFYPFNASLLNKIIQFSKKVTVLYTVFIYIVLQIFFIIWCFIAEIIIRKLNNIIKYKLYIY